ncbi:hypothetical protein JXA32_08645 [Candidatus Sumerlaeota bacterium]|nr:hypothetical protein [Candidatus Sumerlaeota bacterium]
MEPADTNSGMDLDPEMLMRRVRERVRAECAAEDAEEIEQLLLLQREVKQLRDELAGQASALPPSLKDAAMEQLEETEANRDIPPHEAIERIPPLFWLYKAWRKTAFASQRVFNHAVAKLFRHSFHNFMQLERAQLEILRRLEAIEQRLNAVERNRTDAPAKDE